MVETLERPPEQLPPGEAEWLIVNLTEALKATKLKLERDVLISTMLNKEATRQAAQERIRAGKTFGLFVIDLNNFKKVNDEFGHAAGDELLLLIGRLFKSTFKRSTDQIGLQEAIGSVGRIGGDEFVVLVDLDHADRRRSNDITAQMDRIYDLLRTLEERVVATSPIANEVGVGLAVGAAVFDPEHPVDLETLFGQADEAMYEEKGDKGR